MRCCACCWGPEMASWWRGRTRQAWRHVTGRIGRSEFDWLSTWLDPAQRALFDSMHRADQRHGLDVVAHLVEQGESDRELLLAGLLHDCAKGPGVRLRHRVAWALAERYGSWLGRPLCLLPGFGRAFGRLRDHASRSAELALAAGCSPRTARLIRAHAMVLSEEDPGAAGDTAVWALRLADEAA